MDGHFGNYTKPEEIEPDEATTQRTLGQQESDARNVKPSMPGLETVYDTAPVGLAVLDADCRYVRINARLAGFNGIPAADHLGKTVREILPAIADAAEKIVRQIIETGKPMLDVQVEV